MHPWVARVYVVACDMRSKNFHISRVALMSCVARRQPQVMKHPTCRCRHTRVCVCVCVGGGDAHPVLAGAGTG